jgi:hypothetical protein
MMKKFILILFISVTAKISFSQNVGISTTTPTHAKLEINGTVGAAVAMFGADKYGVTIEADNPEIGFNYFYNNGTKTIKAGYASVIGMAPVTGELYMGNFNGNQSLADYGAIGSYRQNFTLFQNGEFRFAGTNNVLHFFNGPYEDTYIRAGKNNGNVIINDIVGGKVGVGVYPTRAVLEQYGSVGTTAAIFGGDGAGISLQKNWPVIGFNHYFDGVNHKSIGQGYSGVFGVNQLNGNLYYASWPFAAIPNATLTGYTGRFVVTRLGKIGVGTEDPQADIEIVNNYGDLYENSGLRISRNGNTYATNWNIFLNQEGHLSFGYSSNGVNNDPVAYIGFNGSWNQQSDRNFKKDISYLQKEDMLKLIKQLRPAKYHFTTEKNNLPLSYGFISQEVETVFPDIVDTQKNGKYISYQNFIPILTKAMQEQQQQIEILQKENTDLKAHMDRLEKLLLKQ